MNISILESIVHTDVFKKKLTMNSIFKKTMNSSIFIQFPIQISLEIMRGMEQTMHTIQISLGRMQEMVQPMQAIKISM